MLLTFGEYLPDLPPFENPGLITAKNVIPRNTSYAQFLDLVENYGALTARCQGGFAARDTDGTTFNFAGDATKLYSLASSAWDDVSGATYSTGSDQRWFYTQYGRRVIATNFANNMQSYVMGTSTDFADLGGSPPKARYLDTVKDFVMIGNVNDTVDGAVPNRVQWCALGDPTDWTPDEATQSDYQDLDAAKGWVTQVVGGEYATIFQERAITRATYSGSPLIFTFDEVETGRGTQAPGSVVKVGGYIFYLGQEGFYLFNGQASEPIGSGKVDKTFFADLDQNYYDRLSSVADPINKLIFWAYPGSGNTGGRCNKILMFNYSPNASKRWATAEVDTEVLFNSLAQGYTLDGLDSVNSSLDALPYSLDSRLYTGNQSVLSAFSSNHKLAAFTGSALAARLETGEAQLVPGKRSQIAKVKPYVDGTSATTTVTMGTRNKRSEAISYGSALSLNSSGEAPMRANAFYHSLRLDIAGGFDYAQGVELTMANQTGAR
jgi:hypothetical protein